MFAIDFEIEESKKKLYLVELEPGRQRLGAGERITCSLNAILGKLTFGSKALEGMEMNESWIKISYDSTNQVIAWRIRKELDNDSLREKGWKFVKKNTHNNCWSVQVKRILETFQHVENKTYKGLEIKKYRDKVSLMDTNSYFFIEIKSV